jgi:hypothetical protein
MRLRTRRSLKNQDCCNMRTHPKISAILKRKNLSPEYRKAVEEADYANKMERAYRGHGTTYRPTPSDVISSMHADLIIAGVEKVNGMSADIWIMRGIRELELSRR